MGVDLRLQGSELRLVQVVLVLADLLDQGFQPVSHLVHLLTQFSQFLHVHAADTVAEVPFCNAPHRFFQ